MKKFFKTVLSLLSQSGDTLISIMSAIVFSKYNTRKNFKRVLKDKDCPKEIYILGNGSSLNTFLEERSSNMPEHVMVVNYFATTPQFKSLKPKHYIMLDNNLCIKADEGNASHQQKLIKALSEIDWNINLYMPADSDSSLISLFKTNQFINVVLYNRTPIDGITAITHFFYNMRLGMPRPQNVSNAAVFCAIASGFKTIYLYGVEHSWTKAFDVDPDTHRVFLDDGHFYESENKRFLPKGEYMRWLNDIAWALRSHYTLRKYADSCGVRIVNKTKQSFVEAYDYED